MGGEIRMPQKSQMQVKKVDWMGARSEDNRPSSAMFNDINRIVTDRADPAPTLFPGGVPAINSATNPDLSSADRAELVRQEVER